MRSTLISELADELGKHKNYVRQILKRMGMSTPYNDRQKVLRALAEHGWPEAQALLDRGGGDVQPAARANRQPMPDIDQAAFAREGAMLVCLDIQKSKRLQVTKQEAIMLYLDASYRERM